MAGLTEAFTMLGGCNSEQRIVGVEFQHLVNQVSSSEWPLCPHKAYKYNKFLFVVAPYLKGMSFEEALHRKIK